MPTSRAGAINKLKVGQALGLRGDLSPAAGPRRRPGRPPQAEGLPHKHQLESGITLIEMLVVVTLIALIAGVSYPSIGSGIESLRLRSAATSISSFLNAAFDRASRSQQPVEIRISPKENSLIARSADMTFTKTLTLPGSIHIASITPTEESAAPDEVRRFLIYPGGGIPKIGVGIVNREGQKRIVSVDPFTGVPIASNPEPEPQK